MTESDKTFYTNVALRGNSILLRGFVNGKPVKEKIPFRPTFYVPASKQTEFRTLEGEYVEPIRPGTMDECKKWIQKYQDVDGFRYYGNNEFVYQFIAKIHPDEIDYDFSLLSIANIDIETTAEKGFPDKNNPEEKVIAITLSVNGWKYVFGLGEFTIDEPKTRYWEFDDEEDLLRCFLDTWELESPHIVTGWNIRYFDIPYLVARIEKLMGTKEVNRLSPWRRVQQKRFFGKTGKEETVYSISGISIYDYYELYRTFTYVNQESYRLEHIAQVELGMGKLDYSEYDTIVEFYQNDFQKFMEYNVRDVEVVDLLEEKMKLLELAVALAYSAKVNLEDVFGQVRVWDCIIYHYLASHNIVIPPKRKVSEKNTQYAGAYVKDPITGKHDWVVSLDLNSLYPHLIMQFNISPETKIDTEKDSSVSVDSILGGYRPDEKTYSVAANGTYYTKEHRGFLPTLMDKMYQERSHYKKLMIQTQKELEEIDRELRKRSG